LHVFVDTEIGIADFTDQTELAFQFPTLQQTTKCGRGFAMFSSELSHSVRGFALARLMIEFAFSRDDQVGPLDRIIEFENVSY